MKKYEDDLDTTLIFVSCLCSQNPHVLIWVTGCLFSAVTAAFILDVQSKLRPDTGDETAALLRVLIYKIDNTTFGNDAPTLLQWTGPPHTIVQVQAILYASLAAALLSAFLAMHGKQWLNQYASADVRGTAIERSQNRQRKLDGIVTRNFDRVMQSPPLMLQVALLLLGCPLSRYLREIDTAVVSVVLGFTFFGIISYLLIIVKGATFGSFPYQTPVSHALCHLGHSALLLIPSISRTFSRSPMPIARFITSDVWLRLPPLSALDTLPPLAIAPDAPLLLAVTLNVLPPFLVALRPIFTPPH